MKLGNCSHARGQVLAARRDRRPSTDMERLKIIRNKSGQSSRPGSGSSNKSRRLLRTGWFICWYGFTGLVGRRPYLLVHELLSRTLRDRKAVARYAGSTGSPDESGSKRRERGLSRSGNARVRKIMIQLAWRMVKFQPDSALVQWFKQRTENAKGSRKPMIVALARKLIIALWSPCECGAVRGRLQAEFSGVIGIASMKILAPRLA